jgi:hypothetical protein
MLLILGIVLGVVAFRLFTLILEGESSIRENYERHFPGKCYDCAWYQAGLQQGSHPAGSIPPDHDCVERWERWRGALHKRR